MVLWAQSTSTVKSGQLTRETQARDNARVIAALPVKGDTVVYCGRVTSIVAIARMSTGPDVFRIPCKGATVSALRYVHRDLYDYKGRGAQDDHLDFHTAPELFFFIVASRPQKPSGLPGTMHESLLDSLPIKGDSVVCCGRVTSMVAITCPPGLTSSGPLVNGLQFQCWPQKPTGLLGTGSPGRPPSLSHGS